MTRRVQRHSPERRPGAVSAATFLSMPSPSPSSATSAESAVLIPRQGRPHGRADLSRRSSSSPAASTTPWPLVAPTDPRGAALSAFAVRVRRAVQDGHRVLEVDESACATWSAGQLVVLEHLRRLAGRCGCEWRTTGRASLAVA